LEEAKKDVAEQPKEETTMLDSASAPEVRESQMIFPKLEKESPVASVHEDAQAEETVRPKAGHDDADDFEVCAEYDDWVEDESDDGFLTDEEYDILDASDEEYLEQQQRKALKK
jgi:next-to-BRCA1 protein 1